MRCRLITFVQVVTMLGLSDGVKGVSLCAGENGEVEAQCLRGLVVGDVLTESVRKLEKALGDVNVRHGLVGRKWK